jgi:hypothetical protein
MIATLALTLWTVAAPQCPQYPAAIVSTCVAPGAAGKLTICQRKAGHASTALRPRERPGEVVCVVVDAASRSGSE